jgi:hypothetical protein
MLRGLRFRTPFILVTLLLFAACGGGDKNASQEEGASSPPTPASDSSSMPSSEPAGAANVPITVEDIARWEKGMAAELAAVQEAGAKLKTAKTSDDTLSAMMGVQEMTTRAAGAKAAGLDEERYNVVRSDLSAAVSYLTPHLGGIDTTMLSPAQREELRQGNAAQLKQMEPRVPAEVVEVLRPKAEELRKKDMELAGARLKGAGI